MCEPRGIKHSIMVCCNIDITRYINYITYNMQRCLAPLKAANHAWISASFVLFMTFNLNLNVKIWNEKSSLLASNTTAARYH